MATTVKTAVCVSCHAIIIMEPAEIGDSIEVPLNENIRWFREGHINCGIKESVKWTDLIMREV